MKYRIVDVHNVEHVLEAQAVIDDPDRNKVTFYADKAKENPVASFSGASSWGPATAAQT